MSNINALLINLGVLWDWITGILNFLGTALVAILSSIGNGLNRIFDGNLFGIINGIIHSLAFYVGTGTAQVLVGLFCLVFVMLFVGFLFRFMKGQIRYVLTWRVHKRL